MFLRLAHSIICKIWLHISCALFIIILYSFTVTFVLEALKGLRHEMDIFWKVYNNKLVLSMHALTVFTIFLFLI
jgi:hypothetical protein